MSRLSKAEAMAASIGMRHHGDPGNPHLGLKCTRCGDDVGPWEDHNEDGSFTGVLDYWTFPGQRICLGCLDGFLQDYFEEECW